MWEIIAALSALVSIMISIIAMWIAKSESKKSISTASDALRIARESNDIALKRIRVSPAVEIFSDDNLSDFTNAEFLKEDLSVKLSIRNIGEVNIDGIMVELIGVVPLTYPENNPSNEIRPLPSIKIDIGLSTMIQPDALAHIDMRLPILKYFVELAKKIGNTSEVYKTSINIVLKPKAFGDSLPSGVLSSDTKNDRKLITARFKPAILSSETVTDFMEKGYISHRVYSP